MPEAIFIDAQFMICDSEFHQIQHFHCAFLLGRSKVHDEQICSPISQVTVGSSIPANRIQESFWWILRSHIAIECGKSWIISSQPFDNHHFLTLDIASEYDIAAMTSPLSERSLWPKVFVPVAIAIVLNSRQKRYSFSKNPRVLNRFFPYVWTICYTGESLR
jgi:hypothetical protein